MPFNKVSSSWNLISPQLATYAVLKSQQVNRRP